MHFKSRLKSSRLIKFILFVQLTSIDNPGVGESNMKGVNVHGDLGREESMSDGE